MRAAPVAEDWAERWRRFHRGVAVGPLWVGPPWERPPARLTPIVIDPGRAFGTGGHATTRLSLELLLRLSPSSALDVGCGSGVLAVAAAKLGHAPVWAVDVDPAAVEATTRNGLANGAEVAVGLADATVDPLPCAEIALVNVALEPLRAIADRLGCRFLVASGYRDVDDARLPGFRSIQRLEMEGWAADLNVRE